MTSQTIPVTLPEKVWGRLASLAEGQGTTVGALLADQIASLLPAETPLGTLRDELTAARAAGFRVPRRELSAEDREWKAGQKRRQNLESFRCMTDEWTELPA